MESNPSALRAAPLQSSKAPTWRGVAYDASWTYRETPNEFESNRRSQRGKAATTNRRTSHTVSVARRGR
jgi:hypothetical protein